MSSSSALLHPSVGSTAASSPAPSPPVASPSSVASLSGVTGLGGSAAVLSASDLLLLAPSLDTLETSLRAVVEWLAAVAVPLAIGLLGLLHLQGSLLASSSTPPLTPTIAPSTSAAAASAAATTGAAGPGGAGGGAGAAQCGNAAILLADNPLGALLSAFLPSPASRERSRRFFEGIGEAGGHAPSVDLCLTVSLLGLLNAVAPHDLCAFQARLP